MSGSVTIDAGHRTVALVVTPVDDGRDETSGSSSGESAGSGSKSAGQFPVERVELTLVGDSAASYSIDAPLQAATASIDDDDRDLPDTSATAEAVVTTRAADPFAAACGPGTPAS